MCITRQKYGRGFQYFDEAGTQIKSEKLLRRFRKLVIPPMWEDVRVCKWPDGHIQASGRDGKGRKQYVYHSEWKNIDSEDVNLFIQKRMGEAFSSKDFRTWVASRLAVAYLPEAESKKVKYPRRQLVNILLRLVAKELGNTPNVCRTHYVHPIVLQHVEEKTMPSLQQYPEGHELHEHSQAEQLLLELIA